MMEVQLVLRTRDVVLSAPGGYGKTELAQEVAHRLEHLNILWLNAATDSFLNESIIDTVQRLDFPPWACSSLPAAKANLADWLLKQPNWLLVVDNVDEPDDIAPIVTDLLPAGLARHGRVLLTTRSNRQDILPLAATFPVPGLSEEEAMRFLRRRTRWGQGDAAEQESLREIAVLLGSWPLALEQAGSALELFERPAEFVEHLRNDLNSGGAWSLNAKPGFGPAAEQNRDVASTLAMNFAEATAEPAALHLIGTLCVMGAGPVPVSFLTSGACELGTELKEAILHADSGAEPIRDILDPLIRHSLAKLDDEGQRVSIHPLIRVALKSMLNPEQRQQFQLNALGALAAAIPLRSLKLVDLRQFNGPCSTPVYRH